MKFLTEAVERGAFDDLRTPAGSIVAGKPALVGSGMCKILPRLDFRDHPPFPERPLPTRPGRALPSLLEEPQEVAHAIAVQTETSDQRSAAPFVHTSKVKKEKESKPKDEQGRKKKRQLSSSDRKRTKKGKFEFD